MDFISIILDPSNKPPSNSPLYCVFGNEGFGREDDDRYYEEGRREHHRGRRDDDDDKESKLDERIGNGEKEEKRIEDEMENIIKKIEMTIVMDLIDIIPT